MSDVKDAVQPVHWYEALPRPQYATLEPVNAVSDWFAIYKLPQNIYAIYEPHHFQEVISFLIIGEEKALLLDTGMGFQSIKTEVEALTNLPLIVVNTHTHFDHIGGNHEFDTVHVFNEKTAEERLAIGIPHVGEFTYELNTNFQPPAFHYKNGEIPVDLNTFSTKPANKVATFEDDHVFDLGGRQFEVVHTPGHSPDSIMLANHAEKILLTGDTIYPASLYAHIQKADGLNSSENTYQSTVHMLAKRFADYDLYCSHNEPLRPGTMLTAVATAFDAIANGEMPYITDEEGLKKYQFDGFAIITR